MTQSRRASLLEAVLNTGAGFLISLYAQWLCLPWLGVTVTLSQNIAFAVIMTGVSIARGYVMRRLFVWAGLRRVLSPFAQAVLAERQRQIEVEGFDTTHDDQERPGTLARAGACFALSAAKYDWGYDDQQHAPGMWPWSLDWWKPQGIRRDLARAGALIIAEGERFDRGRNRRSPDEAKRNPGPAPHSAALHAGYEREREP